MLDVFFSSKFKRDYKLMKKQGKDVELLLDIVDILAAEKPLEPKYKDHPLSGDYIGHRECHIQPDWLLIWKQTGNELELLMLNTGTHSDLFGKKKK